MARHIPVAIWLDTIGLPQYVSIFQAYGGVENMLHLTEGDIRSLGVKNPAHRAHISSGLVILREKLKYKSRLSAPPPVPIDLSALTSDNAPDYASLKRQPGRTSLPKSQREEIQAQTRTIKQPLVLVGEPWYHGNITRVKAEKLLTQDGQFLVRDSISQPGEFVLTARWHGGPLHFKVNSRMFALADGTTKVKYQFEEDAFEDVAQLVKHYVANAKQVSEKSGAIISIPVPRTKPVEHHSGRRDSLRSSRLYAARSQPNIFKMSPELTPSGSPTHSPLTRRKPKRAGSQPLLNFDDDGGSSDNEKPALERRESMPLSTGTFTIPQNQLQDIDGGTYSELTVKPPNGKENHKPSVPLMKKSAKERDPLVKSTSSPPVHSGTGQVENTKKPLEKLSSAPLKSAIKNSPSPGAKLPIKPPPKPSRVPSVKLLKQQKKPYIAVRNTELYEDDGSDYSDYFQVKDWGSAGFANGGRKRTEEDDSYAELPTADTERTADILNMQCHISSPDNKDSYDIPRAPEECVESVVDLVSLPLETMPSFIDLENYSSELLPPNNKPMDNTGVTTIKMLLLESNPRHLAQHITWLDLDMLMVPQGQDLGLRVTSGLELTTLPQGKQLRQDVLERYHCLKMFVALTILVCTRFQDRARMIQQWILIAGELQGDMGNQLSFSAIMDGLRMQQVVRLHNSWIAVKQNFPTSMHQYEAKLISTIKCMEEAMSSLPLQHVTIPYIIPLVELLQRESWDDKNVQLWENDPTTYFGLDILLAHMDTARLITEQFGLYRITSFNLMRGFRPDKAVLDVFRTEMHMNLMWGAKGIGVNQNDRYNKFNQLLMVLSERAEASLSSKAETAL